MNPSPDRDYIGYGRTPPDPKWPHRARLALNFCVNYEAGAELNILDGDLTSESTLTDLGFPAVPGQRSPQVESAFEYGARVGIWRLLRIFAKFDVPISLLAVATAAERNPDVIEAYVEGGHEIVSHGYRWIDYGQVPEEIERDHIRKSVEVITRIAGARPAGSLTGRPSPNTRRLLVEEGGFIYDRDVLNDELPYWLTVAGRPHLAIPYSFETNDNRYDQSLGWSTAEDMFTYVRDAFDVLYEEGADQPKMMTVALHDRLSGRPSRTKGLIRFLDYVRRFDDVWFCRGIDIARHWQDVHPCDAGG